MSPHPKKWKKIYRRKIENPLKCNRYRYLVDNSMDAIILTAADGEFFFANRAACELFGMTELELIQGGRQAIMPVSPPISGNTFSNPSLNKSSYPATSLFRSKMDWRATNTSMKIPGFQYINDHGVPCLGTEQK